MLDISRHLLGLLRCHARQERYARRRQPRTDNSQWRDGCRAGDRRCDAADAADQTDDAPRGRATLILQLFKLRFLFLEPCERVDNVRVDEVVTIGRISELVDDSIERFEDIVRGLAQFLQLADLQMTDERWQQRERGA